METTVQVQKLSFAYGTQQVLRDVSFSAQSGTLLGVLGANGVGKSTLFRCILGFLNGYTGSILLNGTDARTLSASAVSRMVAYIPQTHYPAFRYSVSDMVLMGTTHRIGSFSVPKEREHAACERALRKLGIYDLRDRCYTKLSGGEQQLVLIARALAQESRILLMDEPTSNLDFGNQTAVLECIRSLSQDGYTVLFSTHNPQHALQYADTVLALQNGTVAAFGAAEQVLTPSLLQSLYGVTAHLADTEYGRVILPGRRDG